MLITGATGFLGSHLLNKILSEGHHVLATKRTQSVVSTTSANLAWVNVDTRNWEQAIQFFEPTTFIHAAWEGVTATHRADWALQTKNLVFFQKILAVLATTPVQKLVGLGSQAEYGNYNSIVDEMQEVQPNSAYGAVKVTCSHLLKKFAEESSLAWCWLRVFSTYGPGEGDSWLIPSTIQKLLSPTSEPLFFTKAEQLVNYLYVSDAADLIYGIVQRMNYPDVVGVFNLAGNQTYSLKSLLLLLKQVTGIQAKDLDFGALPYRTNQPMIVSGNAEKLLGLLGNPPLTPLKNGLQQTFHFYQSKFQNESI